MEKLEWFLIGYVVALSLLAFVLMGVDKRRARKDAWRISEQSFFVIALLGGSPAQFWAWSFFVTRPAIGTLSTACPSS